LRIHWAIVASIAVLFFVGVSAHYAPLMAQAAPQGPKPDQSQAQTPSAGPALPSDRKIAMMIFSTLIALNQANATGNYSVLRDMAAPGFQSAHTTAQIAEAFANLRQRNLDLSPILLFQPKLLGMPKINKEGMLRVTGLARRWTMEAVRLGCRHETSSFARCCGRQAGPCPTWQSCEWNTAQTGTWGREARRQRQSGPTRSKPSSKNQAQADGQL
jgi:hypothetical protein